MRMMRHARRSMRDIVFALETYDLARSTFPASAAANIALHIVLGIGALWVGMRHAASLVGQP